MLRQRNASTPKGVDFSRRFPESVHAEAVASVVFLLKCLKESIIIMRLQTKGNLHCNSELGRKKIRNNLFETFLESSFRKKCIDKIVTYRILLGVLLFCGIWWHLCKVLTYFK